MIPNTKDRALSVGGAVASGEFGISLADSAHIMTILRDTLYSDKMLAVLREYSSNAWDAHRECGKGDVPIKVTLPTPTKPVLRIRDFGKGLSTDDVFKVYTQYGSSTKRNSDTSVGMLGIGSKSGFAYSDSFTITSHHEGTKRTFVAVLDASEKGVVNLLLEEPTDETGVEISIAVRPVDVPEFERKARRLFKYFTPRPDINTDLPKLPLTKASSKYGVLYDNDNEYDHTWVAVMGCVSYRIDTDQLRTGKVEEGLGGFAQRTSGAIFCDIGEVTINASREELKYNEATIKLIIERMNLLVDTYVKEAFEQIEAATTVIWERRLKAQALENLGLPIPKKWKELTKSMLELSPPPKGIFFNHGRWLYVKQEASFVLKDTDKPIQGYGLYHHIVVDKADDITWEKAEEILRTYCGHQLVEGVPITKLSLMPWKPPQQKPPRPKKPVDIKHKVRKFVYVPTSNRWPLDPRSRNWELVDRVPDDRDIFVIMSKFEPVDFGRHDFYEVYRSDEVILTSLGMKMPEVFAYKTLANRRVAEADCKGTSYRTWRKKLLADALTPALKADINQYYWGNRIGSLHLDRGFRKGVTEASSILGKKHIAAQYLRKALAARISEKGISRHKTRDAFDLLIEQELIVPEAIEIRKQIAAKYPLFRISNFGMSVLVSGGDDRMHWFNYIKAMDKP